MIPRILEILFHSVRSTLELSLFILLPIMLVMMVLMKLLEARGVLAFVARILTPVLKPFGIPGIGVFAILQSLLVSFAAPVATLSIMESDGTATRKIAATLAMVLTISQANVVFPMLTVGLDLKTVFLTSMIGGVVAAMITYYVFARSKEDASSDPNAEIVNVSAKSKGLLATLVAGGKDAVKLVLKSMPILLLAMCLVNTLRATGVISFLAVSLSPYLSKVDVPGIAVLPIATKYLAGGTAMMGITIPLVQDGSINPVELNRLAGLMINPLDLLGVPVLISAGRRVASTAVAAILGAVVGIAVRSILHYLIFR